MMRPSLFAVLFLLAWTATASAECAWVLWTNFTNNNPTAHDAPSNGGLWTPESAGTRTECEGARDRIWASSAEKQVMGPGTQSLAPALAAESVSVVGPKGQVLWTCLPDTIDPRGPKGK
jgi:hypothetical protein